MNVIEAVERRASVRAFSDRPVPKDVVQSLLSDAALAPSGGNLQPWHIHALTGAPLHGLCDAVAAGEPDPVLANPFYPDHLWEPYRSRRYGLGEALYASIGVGRDDQQGRLDQLAQNYRFFGAPVGLLVFIDRGMGKPQWIDLGLFMQTLMLLAVERGLDTCPQLTWSAYGQTVERFLDVPPELMLVCGIALGHRVGDHAINGWRSERAPFAEWGALHGFDEQPGAGTNEGCQ